jgi:cytochrome d ubiquinol oxidase subunit II
MDSRAIFAYSLLWTVLTLYAVLSSLDFGAGFYYWLAGVRPGRERVRTLTLRYLSPVWETTNVFLVLFIVGMIGFFPGAVAPFATALFVPLSLAVILLALRGAFFAFHHVAAWADRWLAPVFGLGGLLAPALLVSFLAVGETGTSADGSSWRSPLTLLLALEAMAVCAYLSAAYLAHFATRRHDTEVAAFYRMAAVRSGVVAGVLAVGLALALRASAPVHARALVAVWPLHVGSAVAFAGALWLLARGRRRNGIAAALAVGQFALSLVTFGLTRLPYLLYPSVRLDDAFTTPATFTALVITLLAGMLLVVPSLALLYALFVRAPRAPRAPQPAPARPRPPQPAPTLAAPRPRDYSPTAS